MLLKTYSCRNVPEATIGSAEYRRLKTLNRRTFNRYFEEEVGISTYYLNLFKFVPPVFGKVQYLWESRNWYDSTILVRIWITRSRESAIFRNNGCLCNVHKWRFIHDQRQQNEKARHSRLCSTTKCGNIVYPGSHERKFSSLNPASPGPTRSNFLSFAGGVFMPRSGYWGVRTSIFGRSNLATVPRGGFSNGQIFLHFAFL